MAQQSYLIKKKKKGSGRKGGEGQGGGIQRLRRKFKAVR